MRTSGNPREPFSCAAGSTKDLEAKSLLYWRPIYISKIENGRKKVKTVCKGTEPSTLAHFRSSRPKATWDQMCNDTQFGGQQVYKDIRSQVVRDQGGLCAFCEIEVRDNVPLKCHVEHFHPKSDKTSSHNWALDWNNMLAVCNGGCNPSISAPGFYLEPLDRNLSCDAHKDKMMQKGRLSSNCEGWILNPVHLIAFPRLFRIDLAKWKDGTRCGGLCRDSFNRAKQPQFDSGPGPKYHRNAQSELRPIVPGEVENCS